MSTAEPPTPIAIPAFRRLGAPLGTSGRDPGQFRAPDPCRSVSSTIPGRGQCSHHPTSQARRPRHPVLQDMCPSCVCSRLRGFTHPPGTPPRPGHRHSQPDSPLAARTVPGSFPSDSGVHSRVPRPAPHQVGHRSFNSAWAGSGSQSYPSPRLSGSPILKSRRRYMHGLSFPGPQLIAGTGD
jgi:hypothetical protein